MTVNTTTITAGPYAGNDIADTFAFTFRITVNTQLLVFETDTSGIETQLVLNTDYTVTGVGNDNGGSVVRTAGPLPTGHELFIRSDYKATQLTAFSSQGSFLPQTHEDALDKLTFLALQALDRFDRSLSLPAGSTTTQPLVLPTPTPGYFIRWRPDGFGFENVSFSDLPANTITQEVMIVFDTSTDMISNPDLEIGMKVMTLGRLTKDDGGGNVYEIVAAGTGTVDFGRIIDLTGISGQARGLFPGNFITFEQFGAVGNKIANDTVAVQNSVNYSNTAGLPIVCPPDKQYMTDTQITATGDINIRGNGSGIYPTGTTNGIIHSISASGVSTTLSASGRINQNSITLTSATGFAVGDLISIVSSKLWYMDPSPSEDLRSGELTTIQAINGNVITLNDALHENYIIPTETVTVTKLTKTNVSIDDFDIITETPALVVGLEIRNCVNGRLTNVRVDGSQTQAINLHNCYCTNITGCDLRRANRNGTGYGVQINFSVKCHVSLCDFHQCRRGVDISGTSPSRHCHIFSNTLDGGGLASGGASLLDDSGSSAFGSHETSEHNHYYNNEMGNVRNGMLLRGANETVTGNRFFANITLALVQINTAVNWKVSGNTYYANLRPGKTLDDPGTDDDTLKAGYFVQITDPKFNNGFGVLTDNTFDDFEFSFCRINNTVSAPSNTMRNLTIKNNTGKLTGANGAVNVSFIESIGEVVNILDSVILDNPISEEASIFTRYRPNGNLVIDYEDTVDIDYYELPATVITDTSTNMSSLVQKLLLTVKNNVVEITGFINFNATGSPASVRLTGLPSRAITNNTVAVANSSMFIYDDNGSPTTGHIFMERSAGSSERTRAIVSADTTALTVLWPIQNNYSIPVNIKYYTERKDP